jgi:phosphoribosylformylglycinamidine cyclo-ligase
VPRAEMLRAFNMGVGMIAVADADADDAIVRSASAAGIDAWIIGHTEPGSGRVVLR